MKLHQDIARHLQEIDSQQWDATSTTCTIVSSSGSAASSQLNKPTASVVPVMKGYEVNAQNSGEPLLGGVTERCGRAIPLPVFTASIASAGQRSSDTDGEALPRCAGTASNDVDEGGLLNGAEFCAPISDNHLSQSGVIASMPEILPPVDISRTYLPVSRDCASVLSFSSNKENSISDLYPGDESFVNIFL